MWCVDSPLPAPSSVFFLSRKSSISGTIFQVLPFEEEFVLCLGVKAPWEVGWDVAGLSPGGGELLLDRGGPWLGDAAACAY